MCQGLCVSRAGYYRWKDRPISERERANRELVEKVKGVLRSADKRTAAHGYTKPYVVMACGAARSELPG